MDSSTTHLYLILFAELKEAFYYFETISWTVAGKVSSIDLCCGMKVDSFDSSSVAL
jgi:hypothetical protein